MNPEFIFEDGAYERAFFSGELDEASALTAVGTKNALQSITLITAAEDVARRYAEDFGADAFCDEAKAFLCRELCPIFCGAGYEEDVSFDETIAFTLTSHDAAQTKPRAPEGDALLIWCDEGEGERFDFSEIECGEDDGCCALIVDGERVLCAAGINDLRRDGYSEIYVECAEGYRRRKYASACVALLVRKLGEVGQGVRYEVEGTNAASIALARSIGFGEGEHIMSIVVRRNDNN